LRSVSIGAMNIKMMSGTGMTADVGRLAMKW